LGYVAIDWLLTIIYRVK